MQSISTVSLQKLLKDLPQDHHLVDVRNPDEWATGVIKGAKLLSLPLLPLHLSEFSPHETYIMICRSGSRSAQAAEWLDIHGIHHVINYSDGMLGWHAAHLPIIHP